MVNRNTILFFLIFILTGTFWLTGSFLTSDKPKIIDDLEEEQKILNEKLISAQILANKLDRVHTLFQENLALSAVDSLAEDASLPFLNNLTQMLENHNITLLSIRPKSSKTKQNYHESPYDITINCTFKELGEFVAEIEKSPRLIRINEFVIKNGIERIKNVSNPEELKRQNVEMNLSTITLIKSQGSKKS
ncbi:MAG: type 4a pilus biogenesis protein PilO [Candidatus Marinimicrobia bacterium]|nr:type 4a pilus biogenesis protein PilO [Candidatus Neomarinimicrobiota bacterium]